MANGRGEKEIEEEEINYDSLHQFLILGSKHLPPPSPLLSFDSFPFSRFFFFYFSILFNINLNFYL